MTMKAGKSEDYRRRHEAGTFYHTVLKDKVRVKEAVKASTGFKAIITRQQKGLIHEKEKLLAIWFNNQIKKKS